ncbi:hypothetical protein DK870_03590 [Pseudomonas sp. Q1]|nr:hypothetical protein [Pseudomonas sp. Q1]
MACFICGGNVEPVALYDSEEYVCAGCGQYRISVAAIELYKQRDWRFDVYLARRWIADQQGSGTIPLIDSDMATRLMRH